MNFSKLSFAIFGSDYSLRFFKQLMIHLTYSIKTSSPVITTFYDSLMAGDEVYLTSSYLNFAYLSKFERYGFG